MSIDLEDRLALINKPPLEEIVHFDIVNKPPIDELYHFGILGMHWGIRRYQNPDGTLTEEGKKHYAKQEERRLKKEEKIKSEILKDPDKLARNLDKFTEEEIVKAYKQYEWQDKLSKYHKNKDGIVKKGKSLMDDLLGLGQTANDTIKFLNTPAGKMLREKMGLGTHDIGNFKSEEDRQKAARDYKKAMEDYNKLVIENRKNDLELRKQYNDIRTGLGLSNFTDEEWEQFRANNYKTGG